jgi:hypothetical protein
LEENVVRESSGAKKSQTYNKEAIKKTTDAEDGYWKVCLPEYLSHEDLTLGLREPVLGLGHAFKQVTACTKQHFRRKL